MFFNCVVVDKKFLENEVKHVCYRQDSNGNVSVTFELMISNIIYGKDDCPQIIDYLENNGGGKK